MKVADESFVAPNHRTQESLLRLGSLCGFCCIRRSEALAQRPKFEFGVQAQEYDSPL